MSVRDILLLGHPKLYEVCDPVEPGELDDLRAFALRSQRRWLVAKTSQGR